MDPADDSRAMQIVSEAWGKGMRLVEPLSLSFFLSLSLFSLSLSLPVYIRGLCVCNMCISCVLHAHILHSSTCDTSITSS